MRGIQWDHVAGGVLVSAAIAVIVGIVAGIVEAVTR